VQLKIYHTDETQAVPNKLIPKVYPMCTLQPPNDGVCCWIVLALGEEIEELAVASGIDCHVARVPSRDGRVAIGQ
jgi:hypothetical protein